MPKGIKGFIKGHKHSEKTKRKIGVANSNPYYYNCDYCNKRNRTKLSAYKKAKRHFCSMDCYDNKFNQDFNIDWKWRDIIEFCWERYCQKPLRIFMTIK